MVTHKGPELPEQSSGFSQSKILQVYSLLLLDERTWCAECVLLLRAVAEELLKGQNPNEFCSIKSALTKPPPDSTNPGVGRARLSLEKRVCSHMKPQLLVN